MDQNGSGSLNFIHQIYGFVLHEPVQVNCSNDDSNRFYPELNSLLKIQQHFVNKIFAGRFILFIVNITLYTIYTTYKTGAYQLN